MKYIHLTLALHATATREDGTLWHVGHASQSARFVSQSFGNVSVVLPDGTEAIVDASDVQRRVEYVEQNWTAVRAAYDRRATCAC